MLVANACNKWDFLLRPFQAFCWADILHSCGECKPLCNTSHSTPLFILLSSVWFLNTGIKNGGKCIGCKRGGSVLLQFVTNASLDPWQVHSLLLSHGRNMSLCYLLLHCSTNLSSWHNRGLHVSTQALWHTATASYPDRLLSNAGTSICSINLPPFNLKSQFFCSLGWAIIQVAQSQAGKL